MFHGIEFSSVGWVFAVLVEYNSEKFIHTSDLCGPMIEDYVNWIIKENPRFLFVDGPTTYLYGYILNTINLKRCNENMLNIIEKCNSDIILYDHHPPREKKFKTHTIIVWEKAKQLGINLYTVAEYLGKQNIVELYKDNS